MTLAHIAGVPVEEWLMPFIIAAGAALVGMRAMSVRRKARPPREPVVELIDSARGERAATSDKKTR